MDPCGEYVVPGLRDVERSSGLMLRLSRCCAGSRDCPALLTTDGRLMFRASICGQYADRGILRAYLLQETCSAHGELRVELFDCGGVRSASRCSAIAPHRIERLLRPPDVFGDPGLYDGAHLRDADSNIAARSVHGFSFRCRMRHRAVGASECLGVRKGWEKEYDAKQERQHKSACAQYHSASIPRARRFLPRSCVQDRIGLHVDGNSTWRRQVFLAASGV